MEFANRHLMFAGIYVKLATPIDGLLQRNEREPAAALFLKIVLFDRHDSSPHSPALYMNRRPNTVKNFSSKSSLLSLQTIRTSDTIMPELMEASGGQEGSEPERKSRPAARARMK